MPGTACADVLWDVAAQLDDAKTGRSQPQFVLSLDQAKCFDRLHLDTLTAITRRLNLPGCNHALGNYGNLQRWLFIEGQPSDVLL